MSIRIEKAGMQTSVQDQGRFGAQQFGVTVAGAVDSRSLTLANLLVGNPEDAAALEITILGPRIRFLSDTVFAVTGANMEPVMLNQMPVKMYQSILARAGDVLSIGVAKNGCRAYLAFAGGIDVPLIMGSRSTFLRGSFGGLEGRKLRDGDVLELGKASEDLAVLSGKSLVPETFAERSITVRVVRGPQDDYFTDKGYKILLNTAFQVTSECDRMGIRLEGEEIEHAKNGNIISDGIVCGSIQVPPNGKPIIMLVERQTTGGYPKIATVISVDLPMIAQVKPEMSICFKEISVEEAQDIYVQNINRMKQVEKSLKRQRAVKDRERGAARRLTKLFS